MSLINKTISPFVLNDLVPIPTGHTTVCTVNQVVIQVLEMEDVLFHLNSAVMMPEAPGGKSSTQGSEDDASDPEDTTIQAGQQQMTGLRALSLAFRQFEFDPRYRILIAGHTDTSGTYAFNYTLSELRAKCVLYLLTGNSLLWAENSASRHRIEDYQQILKYSSNTRGWACDPGKIDNVWGDNTSNATEAFFQQTAPTESTEIVTAIRRHPEKKWHARAWEIVYELYNEVLAQTLGTTPSGMAIFRDRVRFLEADNPYVACGESFPLDDAERNNYRSQLNRRVEILFFDEEIPDVITCPESRNRAHTEDECPLRNPDFLLREYLDPNDMHGVVYHLKFQYFDRIKKQIMDVPAGLNISAYRDDGTQVPSRNIYTDGTYTVVVQFPSETEANNHADTIYFTFSAADCWLFSENDDAAVPPVVKEAVNQATWNAMTAAQKEGHVCFDNMSMVDKYKYYDLPGSWDSRNWMCKVGNNRDEFSNHMTTRTSESAPIKFNLDTIVLLDTDGGTQGVRDENHLGTAVDLDATGSRVKLFCADQNTGDLELYKSGAADTTSRIAFPRNRIDADAQDIKIVFFRNGFYPVLNRRSVAETNWVADGYLVGARAALRNDENCFFQWGMKERQTLLGYTGDYDLCFFHQLSVVDTHPVSYLIVYVSISFMRDSRWPDGDTNPRHNVPSQDAVNRFVNEGVYNSMERFNDKKYFFDEETAGASTDQIRPFYFFDERETFRVDNATRPTGINFDQSANLPTLMSHAAVRQARENAFGAISKFLALICRDSSATSRYGKAYHWPVRNSSNRPYSIFKLNESAYHGVNGPFSSVFPVNEDGVRYTVFTFAHELGHATGSADEYLKDEYMIGTNGYNSFPQFYECYTMRRNRSSLMYNNGAPRTHHLVYYLNKINEQIQSGDLRTKGWLGGKYFIGKYDFSGGSYTYTRRQTGMTITQDPRVPIHVERKHAIRARDPKKTLSLKLYYVSQDESSSRRFHRSQNIEYQAVLMVRVMLSTDFSWLTSTANRANRVSAINDAWSNLSCRYRLVRGSGHIQNIIIHFLTGFSHEDETATRNYQVDFSWHGIGSRVIIPSSGTSDEVTIRSDATGEDVVAFFLNIANRADLNNSAAMVGHLSFFKTWVDNGIGGNFTLEAV